MLALYRDGRQSEALATCHEARRLLVDGFGLDPGDELAALAQAVLRQDPELLPVPPPTAPVTVSPADGPAPVTAAGVAPSARSRLVLPLDRFVGRDHELAEVRRLVATHRLVTLTGPGGSGKTRLAREVCRGLPQPADPTG